MAVGSPLRPVTFAAMSPGPVLQYGHVFFSSYEQIFNSSRMWLIVCAIIASTAYLAMHVITVAFRVDDFSP